VHYTTSCNTQYNATEDGRDHCPKHVELIVIINKPLLLHPVCCLYYLYRWCTVKQISNSPVFFFGLCENDKVIMLSCRAGKFFTKLLSVDFSI